MKPKQMKREEADARNAAWAALSPEQQLMALATRPGASTRQRARIQRNQLKEKK